MSELNLIAVDLAKNVFQVCGMTARHKVIFNRQLRRQELAVFMAQQPTVEVAMEACYSSHYWARHFQSLGHQVTLIPAQHVTPFVRGNKSDRNDALAIAEAARRPSLRPVPVKSVEQQDIQCLHRLRERYLSQRTRLINQTRGLLSEFGIVAPQGLKAFRELLQAASDSREQRLSERFKRQLHCIHADYELLRQRIKDLDAELATLAASNTLCQLLQSIPGIGVINATALVSAIGNGSQFANGRELAVWLGLTPRQSSSGERFHSAGITKRGNRYLRKQLVHGARALLITSKRKTDPLSNWINRLVQRRGIHKACVALAARLARLSWVLLQRQTPYRAAA
jgi:transposase